MGYRTTGYAMGHHRIDAIEDRIARLRERTDDLHEEFAGVRSRIRALEGDGTGPARGRAGTPDRAARSSQPDARTRPAGGARQVGRGGPSGGGGPTPADDQASDAEVEAAVRRVETSDGSPSIEEPSADGPATEPAGDGGSVHGKPVASDDDGGGEDEGGDGAESQEIIVA